MVHYSRDTVNGKPLKKYNKNDIPLQTLAHKVFWGFCNKYV